MASKTDIMSIIDSIVENPRVKLSLQVVINEKNRDNIIQTITNFVMSFRSTEHRYPTAGDFLEECEAFAFLYNWYKE